MNVKIEHPRDEKTGKLKPVPKVILAEAIVNVSQGMKDLQTSGLNKRAIVVLLQDATHMSKGDITTILDALPRLAGWYCR